MKTRIFFIFILIIISIWSVKPLLESGFFPMHDDTQVSRVVVMGKALQNGQFPVRLVSDLGYGFGYPIFNFYSPMPYYFGGFLYAVGTPAIAATKIMIIVGVLISGITMFLLAQKIYGKIGALISAILYLYAPYHAVQIYVRGAIGELWAFAFFPLIILGFIYIYEKNSKTGILVGGIGLFGVIISHTLIAYITLIGCLSWIILRLIINIFFHKPQQWLKSEIFLISVGLGLSAFFWLPAFFELKYTSVSKMVSRESSYQQHFVCLKQLWESPWGFGGSAPGCFDGMSFKLGKINILIAILGLTITLFIKKFRNKKYIISGLIICIISIFFMINISDFFWKLIPMFKYIQFPWRFLIYTSFGLAIIGGSIVLLSEKSRFFKLLIGISVIILIIANSTKLFQPQYIYQKSDSDFENINDLRFRVSKISDEYLPQQIKRPLNEQSIVHDTILSTDSLSVLDQYHRETYKKYALVSQTQQKVKVNISDFPGWEYWVNGKKQTPIMNNGLPEIIVPQGDSEVEFIFKDTPIRLIGNLISVISFMVILYYYGKKTIY
jgi:uncharacterized membrane protein